MFIYSFRANTIKFFGIVAVAVILLVSLVIFIPDYGSSAVVSAEGSQSIKYDKIKTDEDRINFLKQFSWEVEPIPSETIDVTIPGEFHKIFAGYNEIQKQQGLDLSKYKNKDMKRYTYIVTNYDGYKGTVYANLLVYRNRVVGGDICSADVNGFVHSFAR